MKSFLKLLAVGLVAITATNVLAQSRDLSAERLIVDDGNNTGKLTISYDGPGDAQFIIPSGPATTVEPGAFNGQTLRWDGAEWIASSSLQNDGLNITVPVGHLELTLGNLTLGAGTITGNGSGITNLNASNVATGALDLARISTTGADEGEALMYSSGNLVYGNPAAGSLVLPIAASGDNSNSLFSITNIGAPPFPSSPSAAYFRLSNAAAGGSAVYAEHNGVGNGVTIVTASGHGVLSTSIDGTAGYFVNENASNSNPVLYARQEGTGNAIEATGGDITLDNGVYNGDGSGLTNVTASDLELPFEGTGASASAFFSVINSDNSGAGTAAAGSFIMNGGLNEGRALFVQNYGNGDGIVATTSSGIAVLASTDYGVGVSALVGTSGAAGHFQNNGGSNTSPTLQAVNSNGPAPAGKFFALGSGNAGNFVIDNGANSSAAVEISTNGTGPALLLSSGGFVATPITIGAGSIPFTYTIVDLNNGGAGLAVVALPDAGTDGQVIVTAASDPDGAQVTNTETAIAYTIPYGTNKIFVRVGGVWTANN